MLIIPYIAWTSIGYLLGSLPFGLLLTHAAGLGDIRSVGSGNIGATNVLRAGGKRLAAATLLLDGGKGALAVWLARHFGSTDVTLPALAGFAAFIGHLFPLWLKFKGGKGVATFIGVVLALHWPLALLFGVVWAVAALGMRISSLAALVATLVTLVCAFYALDGHSSVVIAVMSALIVIRHRANIKRLMRGTEAKIGG